MMEDKSAEIIGNVLILSLFIFYNFLFHSSVCKCIDSVLSYMYNHDTFYMITTQFSGGFGNMVVKTKNPENGWSDPVKLQFEGIDPSLFFDDNG